MNNGRYLSDARRVGCWLLAYVFLILAGTAALSQESNVVRPLGWMTMQNGGTATVSAISNGGRTATIHYFNSSGAQATAQVAANANRAKWAAATGSNPAFLAGYLAFAPTQAGGAQEECFAEGAFDPMCLYSIPGELPPCKLTSAPTSAGLDASWYNYTCAQAVANWGVGIYTTNPESICPLMIHKLAYKCETWFMGNYGKTEEIPNYQGRDMYHVKLERTVYGGPMQCAVGDVQCWIDRMKNTHEYWWGMFQDWFYGHDGDASDYAGPMRAPGRGAPPGSPSVVPDIWDPVDVPGVEPGTPIPVTNPGRPPAFDPTRNPGYQPGTTPWAPGVTNPNPAPGTNPNPDPNPNPNPDPNPNPNPNPDPEPQPQPGTNVNVDVNFPEKIDVRCIEGCGVEFQGLEENKELPSKTIRVPSLSGEAFAPGACPQVASASIMGTSVDFDLTPVCDSASMIKGYIIGMAMLAGVVIVVGAFK